MSVSLKRRVEALEAALGSDDVTHEEIVGWSMRRRSVRRRDSAPV